jgi:hypothetical protein
MRVFTTSKGLVTHVAVATLTPLVANSLKNDERGFFMGGCGDDGDAAASAPLGCRRRSCC